MNQSFYLDASVETMIQDTKEQFYGNNSHYHKALEISKCITAYSKAPEGQSYYDLKELVSVFHESVCELISVLDQKDQYTRNHCQRVTQITIAIGQALGLSKEDMLCLEFAGLLHDIGKVAIPAEIINKEGRLTQQEYDMIKLHPVIGYMLTNDLDFLEYSREILLQHHERIDGKGYPKGLTGSQIDIKAKVLAVADAYDAMTSSRPYNKTGKTVLEAVYELEKNINTQFDSKVVNTFIQLINSGVVM